MASTFLLNKAPPPPRVLSSGGFLRQLARAATLVALLGLCALVHSFNMDAPPLARNDLALLQARQQARHRRSLIPSAERTRTIRADGQIRHGGQSLLPTQKSTTTDMASTSPMQRTFAGKHVYILSHELSVSGAPRVCTELARILLSAGARVSLATHPQSTASVDEMAHQVSSLIPDAKGLHLFADAPIDVASTADLVIVSTSIPLHVDWLRRFRDAYRSYPALTWWIHESSAVVSDYPHPKADAQAVVDIMSAQHPRVVNAVLFPSWSARTWWINQIAHTGRIPTVTRLPAVAAVMHWGLPSWRADKMHKTKADVRIRAVFRAQRGYGDDHFVFVALGTYAPHKGYAGIFKAFDLARKLCGPNLRLLTSGSMGKLDFDSPELAWVKEDKDVRLEKPTAAVPAFLAAGDAFISNTKAGGETWGLATLEALAMGLPSLISRAGGAIEMVDHGVTALMHDVADVARPKDDTEEEAPRLASHMCALAIDARLREHLGAAGQRLVSEQLNQAHIEEALVNTFAGLVQASAAWRSLS